MGISQQIAAMATVAVLLGAVASCSAAGLTPGDQGPAGPGSAGHGPAVTLRIAVYGAPGYRQADLFAAYERLHPGVHIVEDTTPRRSRVTGRACSGTWPPAGGSMTSSRSP